MIIYLIPARRGSKGCPGKNRILVPRMLPPLVDAYSEQVVISTDDPALKDLPCRTIDRPPSLASDTASMKDVLLHSVEVLNMKSDDILVTLYPTYPYRTAQQINTVVDLFNDQGSYSALCTYPAENHPYQTIHFNGNKGVPFIDHEYYRRQDYPPAYVVSHFICIHKVSELLKIDNNLRNDDTFYFVLDQKPVDIDKEEDLETWMRTSEYTQNTQIGM